MPQRPIGTRLEAGITFSNNVRRGDIVRVVGHPGRNNNTIFNETTGVDLGDESWGLVVGVDNAWTLVEEEVPMKYVAIAMCRTLGTITPRSRTSDSFEDAQRSIREVWSGMMGHDFHIVPIRSIAKVNDRGEIIEDYRNG